MRGLVVGVLAPRRHDAEFQRANLAPRERQPPAETVVAGAVRESELDLALLMQYSG